MSLKATAAVWQHSQHSGAKLTMLLALADFADEQGRAWPSVPTLARKCRMTQRNAQSLISGLKSSGELEVLKGEGPHGVNVYRINLEGLGMKVSAGGMKVSAGGGEVLRLNPLIEPSPKQLLNLQEPPRTHASALREGAENLPTDWELPNAWRAWCTAQLPALNVEDVARCFMRDWEASSPPGLENWRSYCRGAALAQATAHRVQTSASPCEVQP